MGATNVTGRVEASILKNGPVQPSFQPAVDVVNGGVMLAIPALLHCGLLNHVDKHFKLSNGYYGISSIILTLAFAALARVQSLEQLRYKPPGEWGKLLGLDRIPEVKILREKIKQLAQNDKAKKWSVDLSNDWLQTLPEGSAALYIDGHVRVYHGKKFNIPKHYVPRIKLCLHAACDYWVNSMDGQPFFMVSQAIDPGIIQTIETEIIPSLEKNVPNQPSQQKLKSDPHLSRFTIVFDREGYSPDLMFRLWTKRIAVKTYAKYQSADWPIDEFTEQFVKLSCGEESTMKLAERGLKLIPQSTKKNTKKTNSRKEEKEEKTLWVREIRKLNKDNSQTTIYTTEFYTSTGQAAAGMFARWCQENFFKYMRKHYGIDDLITYSAQDCPDRVQVVNPDYRRLDRQIRKLTASHARQLQHLRKLDIKCDIDAEKIEEILEKRKESRGKVENLEKEIVELKVQRKNTNKHILVKELSDEEKINFLSEPSKQLVDTIKIICYRAETAMNLTIKENMSRECDARSLLQAIYKSEADLIPDNEKKILTIRLHNLANQASSESIRHLCVELNKTRTIFPGTDLRLIYEIIS